MYAELGITCHWRASPELQGNAELRCGVLGIIQLELLEQRVTEAVPQMLHGAAPITWCKGTSSLEACSGSSPITCGGRDLFGPQGPACATQHTPAVPVSYL